MKILILSLTLISLLLFQQCTSENEQKGVKLIEPWFQTNSILIGHGFQRNTDGKDIDYVEIKIKNSPIANDPDIGLDGTISMAAQAFYKNMNEEEKAKYNMLKIEVEQNIGGVKNKVETSYFLSDLAKVDAIGETFGKALENLKNNNIEDLYTLFDDRVKNNMPIDSIKVASEVMNTNWGTITNIGIRGFKFEEEKLENGEKMRNLRFWAGLTRTKMKEGDKHIVDIWFDDKKEIVGFSF